ncbi:hypothetical protein [Candidatus Lokiarchaeum ossiferum]
MTIEKKYLISCWGTIILFGVLLFTLWKGSSSGTTLFLVIFIIILCLISCYLGNKPGEFQAPKSSES